MQPKSNAKFLGHIISEPLQIVKCEGACEKHNGEVKRVKVSGEHLLAPWYFNYCQEAREADEGNGFTVEILPEETESLQPGQSE